MLVFYEDIMREAKIPEKLWKDMLALTGEGLGYGETSIGLDPMIHVSTPTMEHHTGGFYWLMDAGKSPERVDLWLSDFASYIRKESKRDDFARLTAVDNHKFFEFGRPATDEYPTSSTICVARKGKQVVVTGDRPELMVAYLSGAPDKRMSDDPRFQEAHSIL